MPATLIGVNPTVPVAETEYQSSGKAFGLGDVHDDGNGKRYMYVQASGAISQYAAVAISEAYQAAELTATLAGDNHKIAVSPAAFADNDYGWVQIYGPATAEVEANVAVDVPLRTSATTGHFGTSTTGHVVIRGIVVTTAGSTTTADTVPVFMSTEPNSDTF